MYFKSTTDFCMQLMGEVQLLRSQSEYLDACLPPLEDLSAYIKDYTEEQSICLFNVLNHRNFLTVHTCNAFPETKQKNF